MFEQIIARNEGKTLEFKRDLSSPAPIIKTIVAFANSSGGIIAIGIDTDTKAVLGVDNPLDEEERLASLITDRIEPRLAPAIEVLQAGEKSVPVVEVYPSGSRPHWVRREGSSDGVYVRLGSTNRRADAGYKVARTTRHLFPTSLPTISRSTRLSTLSRRVGAVRAVRRP